MGASTTPLAGIDVGFHRMATAIIVPSNATVVGQLEEMPSFGATRASDDFHVYGDHYRRSIMTLIEIDDQDFSGVYVGDDADQIAMQAQVDSGALSNFAYTGTPADDYTEGFIWRFQGYVMSYVLEFPKDGKIMFKIGIKVHGQPVYATLPE